MVTVILTTLLGTFVLSMMVLILILSFIIGQLLKERTSKKILYISTASISLITLIGFMLLQSFEKIPKAAVLIKPFKDAIHDAVLTSGVDSNYRQMFEEVFRQSTVQLLAISL